MKKSLVVALALCFGIGSVTSVYARHQKKSRRAQAKAAVAQYVATIGPSLQAQLPTLAATDVVTVIVSFHTATGLQQSHLDVLAARGIPAPVSSQLPALGMVAANLTAAQISSLAANPSVRSIWPNEPLRYDLHQARVLSGVDKLRADPAMTALNGGKVVDGTGELSPIAGQPNRPQFSAVVIDSGIDTRNVDLPFDFVTSALGMVPTTKVIQNVQVFAAEGDEGTPPAFNFREHMQQNDSVGHGTHVAGIVGGTGRFSRTTRATTGPNGEVGGAGTGSFENFSGAAGNMAGAQDSGVKIIGCGSGAGLFILSALGGFEYTLQNQVKYNIRMTNNSYGSDGPYNPDEPLNIATKKAFDAGIISAFSAGNSGPGVDTIGRNAKSPYVLCVAAGTKEGGLAGFSSRGLPASQRTGSKKDSKGNEYNPNEFNLPAINAPGTGREFEFNAPGGSAGKGFYSDMISTRADIPGAATGTNDQEFPAPYQANYTQISGTSMSCPFLIGTVALLLDANPALTFTEIKTILQQTASQMPGYADHEAGAGYVNVFAAVDKVFNPNKPYAPFTFRDPEDFNTAVTSAALPPPSTRTPGYPPATVQVNPGGEEAFAMPYTSNSVPASNRNQADAKAKQYPANNAYAFDVVVDPATGKAPTIIDVRIQFGKTPQTSEGNSLGLFLWAPDGKSYSSGLALPVLDSPTRQVVVKNPVLGLWVAELRPVRGLAAIPITPPVGGALPDQTTGQIFRTNLTVSEPNDIAEVAQSEDIRFSLSNRYLDTFADPARAGQTSFVPTAPVTKLDFLDVLVLNTPLRQSLASATPRFTDVDPTTSRWAEAAAQNGSTLRDYDFTPAPVLPSTGSTFAPNTIMTRAQVAVAMVRALGLDREAQALKGVTVSYTYKDKSYPVEDIPKYDPASPDANTENGYLQLAINRGLLPIVPQVRPGGIVTVRAYPGRPLVRADLATVVKNFRQIFGVGNTLEESEIQPEDE